MCEALPCLAPHPLLRSFFRHRFIRTCDQQIPVGPGELFVKRTLLLEGILCCINL